MLFCSGKAFEVRNYYQGRRHQSYRKSRSHHRSTNNSPLQNNVGASVVVLLSLAHLITAAKTVVTIARFRLVSSFGHSETRLRHPSLGHNQQEHETSHGSMSHTHWAVDGVDGASIELKGRRFSANDEGAPMMCNLVCQEMGRHVHVDYCRSPSGTPCVLNDGEHITARMQPEPDRKKDYISHSLYWRRTGGRLYGL